MRLHMPFPRKGILLISQILALPAMQDIFVNPQFPANFPNSAAPFQYQPYRVPFELLVVDLPLLVLHDMPPCLILGQPFRHVHDIGGRSG